MDALNTVNEYNHIHTIQYYIILRERATNHIINLSEIATFMICATRITTEIKNYIYLLFVYNTINIHI